MKIRLVNSQDVIKEYEEVEWAKMNKMSSSIMGHDIRYAGNCMIDSDDSNSVYATFEVPNLNGEKIRYAVMIDK